MTWINITDIKTISPKLKERFCKDCNIPIKIFEEPYFLERLKLYHKQFDTLNKWMKFLLELEKYKSEQDYFEEYNRVKEAAIGAIKNSNGYKDFLELDMSKLPFHVNFYDITSKDIFHPDNDGRIFISIDMKQANYSSLNKISPSWTSPKISFAISSANFLVWTASLPSAATAPSAVLPTFPCAAYPPSALRALLITTLPQRITPLALIPL